MILQYHFENSNRRERGGTLEKVLNALRTSAPSAVKSVQSEEFRPKFIITNRITTNHDTDCDITYDRLATQLVTGEQP